MQRKIPISALRLGMYIEKLDGSWLKHPFWKSSFLLEEKNDLNTLKNSEISHVWIDTKKGDDLPAEKPESVQVVEPEPEPEPDEPEKTSFEDELNSARQTLEKARQVTTEMFQEARLGKSITTSEVAPLVNEVSQSVIRNPAAMLSLTRMKTKDDYTYMHSVAVCALMIALGKQLNYQGDLQVLGTAGLLHDIGKMAMPEEVLNKPGKLTNEEFEIMKAHPRKGWEILTESFDVDEIVLDVCLHHHEKIDGSGYPDRLPEDSISLATRMGTVCDVYDAITSERCYKRAWQPAEALKKMAEWKNENFDGAIFNTFVKTVGIYPTGTLLRLKSGRLAIVTEQSEQTLLKPSVKIFYSTTSKSQIPQKIIDLTRSQEIVVSIETPEAWGFNLQRLMDILAS